MRRDLRESTACVYFRHSANGWSVGGRQGSCVRTVEEIAHMAIAGEVDPRPARAHAVSRLALRHRVEGAGRTPLVCAAFHCAARPAAASEAIHARVRTQVLDAAVVRTALVTVGSVRVQGLRKLRRACVVAKGEAEPTWSRRYAGRSRGQHDAPACTGVINKRRREHDERRHEPHA